jgi:hypothetical protein
MNAIYFDDEKDDIPRLVATLRDTYGLDVP